MQAKNAPEMRCDTCGRPSDALHVDFFGGPQQCADCLTTGRIEVMLACLPHADDRTWDDLRPPEQRLLTALRGQFAKTKRLTDQQYLALEKLWDDHA